MLKSTKICIQSADFFAFFTNIFVYIKKMLYLCGRKGLQQPLPLAPTALKSGDIFKKKRLKRFVLASWNLVNSITTKTMRHEDAHSVYSRTRIARTYTYGVGYGVVCSE